MRSILLIKMFFIASIAPLSCKFHIYVLKLGIIPSYSSKIVNMNTYVFRNCNMTEQSEQSTSTAFCDGFDKGVRVGTNLANKVCNPNDFITFTLSLIALRNSSALR